MHVSFTSTSDQDNWKEVGGNLVPRLLSKQSLHGVVDK